MGGEWEVEVEEDSVAAVTGEESMVVAGVTVEEETVSVVATVVEGWLVEVEGAEKVTEGMGAEPRVVVVKAEEDWVVVVRDEERVAEGTWVGVRVGVAMVEEATVGVVRVEGGREKAAMEGSNPPEMGPSSRSSSRGPPAQQPTSAHQAAP